LAADATVRGNRAKLVQLVDRLDTPAGPFPMEAARR
jgi:hypothetical protein